MRRARLVLRAMRLANLCGDGVGACRAHCHAARGRRRRARRGATRAACGGRRPSASGASTASRRYTSPRPRVGGGGSAHARVRGAGDASYYSMDPSFLAAGAGAIRSDGSYRKTQVPRVCAIACRHAIWRLWMDRWRTVEMRG